MASDLMTVAALGRPFTLGMLYDARKDELIPGFTLWDEKTLQEHTTESAQHSSGFEISASDNIESRSSLLDVDASLKVSFLSGLIEVEGSAKYLNDTKKFKNQSRVTCQYKATTHFKQLPVSHLVSMDTRQIDVIKKGLATHVVTGILYGANVFFVFDSEKLEASNIQEIQGSMEAVIKKIPKFNVEGKVDIKLTEEEKALTNKFSCKFYGDFILNSDPTTFEDAVKTYAELPKLLEEKGEKSVPMKVWLTPLKHFDSKAAGLLGEISVGLVMKAQNVFEDFREIRMRCSDSLGDRVVKNFPMIQEELSRFLKLCDYYKSNLKKTVAKKLPSVREGKINVSSVKILFEDRETSPFSHKKLTEWLEHKEREITVIRSCVDMMEGTKIVSNRSELDREVMAPGVEDALCFVFTSLDSSDPCLDTMADYLNSSKVRYTNEDLWYYSDEVLIKMREKAKDFHTLAEALKNSSRFHFLVAAVANNKYKGATMYHYRDGILVTDDFSKPDIPPVESITDRRNLIWYACDLNLDPNTTNQYLTLSEGNKKATYTAWQTYPDHPERFDYHPQVLCKEKLTGRHYWEVECSASSYQSVYVAVACSQIERKSSGEHSQFGNNTKSWCFGQYADLRESKLRAWHNGLVWESPSPCSRVGVFFDGLSGTVSFYSASSETLSHLYTFTSTFTEPAYVGLWVAQSGNYAYLCPFK